MLSHLKAFFTKLLKNKKKKQKTKKKNTFTQFAGNKISSDA